MREPPPRPRRLRRLSDEEIALWAAVARTVARRPGAAVPVPSTPAARTPGPSPTAAKPLRGSPAKPAAPALTPAGWRLKRDLRRGRAAIDAALDLHGLTQAEAHRALRHFLRQSQARGAKLVIVVTGKGAGPLAAPGRPANERGVLRRFVPHWLRESDLRAVVLGFEEAGPAHGGSGALYVRLRRLGLR